MRRRIFVLLILIPLLPWLIIANHFFYGRFNEYSDLTVSHLPNAIYLLSSLKEYHRIPFWSDLIFSGYPFAANPLAGLWYPPGWVAYVFPQPLGFNLVVFLHLLWGTFGMKRLLESFRLSRFASMFGAVGFLIMPKLFAHLFAGHITLIYAVCWTPWLILNQNVNRRNSRWLLNGAILGLIALADVRWLAYASLLWIGYCLYQYFQKERKLSIKITAVEIFAVLSLAILLSAVLLIPLVQYVELSTRGSMGQSDAAVNSLPIEEIFGLWIPDFGGFAEWVLYPGAVVFCLAVYSLVIPEIRKRTLFWWIVFLVSLLLSFGDSLPIYGAVSSLPGMDLLRVPTRFYFLAGQALLIIAAHGLDDLMQRKDVFRPDPVFFMTPFLAFCGFFGLGFYFFEGIVPDNLLWGFMIFLLTIILIALIERKKQHLSLAVGLLVVISIIDLSMVNFQSVKIIKPDYIYSEGRRAAEYIKSRGDNFRIYSPSYSIPQHTAAIFNIRMVNGVDPMILHKYQTFFEKASGVPVSEYSVTLPPFPNGEPKTDNRNYEPDLELMSLLGVRFIVSEFDIASLENYKIEQFSSTRIYENPKFFGLAWVERNGEKIPVDNIKMEADKIEISYSDSGKLFVSHVLYPGWVAYLDGEIFPISTVYDLFPVFETVSNGQHILMLEFHPRLVSWGSILSVISWMLVGLIVALQHKNAR